MMSGLLGDAAWPIALLVLFELVLVLRLLSRRRERGHTGKPLVEDVLKLAARPRDAQHSVP